MHTDARGNVLLAMDSQGKNEGECVHSLFGGSRDVLRVVLRRLGYTPSGRAQVVLIGTKCIRNRGSNPDEVA
jgi:hypothetical protein